MKLGCHAVLFTESIATDTENILLALHAAGAKGAEIGSRFFGVEKAEELVSVLDKAQIELSGLHTIAPLITLLDEPQEAERVLENAAEFLRKTACRNIISTGAIESGAMNVDNLGDDRLTKPENARRIAENLNRISVRIKSEYGVQIHYHNHNWEFKNNALIFNALVNYAPDLCFALDTGWAAICGYDPAVLICDTCKGRVHYVHLRDFSRAIAANCKTFEEYQNSYVELGEGDMNYKDLLARLSTALSAEDWAVIEYEKGPVDVKRYQDALVYVRKVMSEIDI